MPGPQTSGLLQSSITTSAIIAIPGTSSKGTSRRHAKNPAANLSAYVVGNPALLKAPDAAITVSMKKGKRLLGLSLKGHAAPVVDLEFLATKVADPLHVLGSCDQDGIVYLWFMYVEKDALGIDVRLRLLRKYSFFSLRKSTTAFYSRIRLAGTSENGTMVLVPNDGSNVRVVTFHCEPTDDPNGKPNVPVIAPPPTVKALPAPEDQPIPPAPEPSLDQETHHNPPQQDLPPPSEPPFEPVEKEDEFEDTHFNVVPTAPMPPTDNTRDAGLNDDRAVIDHVVEDSEDDDEIEDIDQYDDEDYEDDFERETNGQVVGYAPIPS